MLLTLLFACLIVSSSSALSLDEFFPFGPEVGDITIPSNDDESEGPLPLPYVFPYFDNNHRQIWIANNGLFSFLSPIPTFVPDPFPLGNDSRLVAGFWTDIDTQGILNDTGNKVYYQIYDNTQPSNSTPSIFDRTSNYVRNFFPQQRLFEPKMIITATWYRVGAYSIQTAELNTFQIVLSTDTDRSFVFFLYHDIQWTHTPGSTNSHAQAGFNAGDGITFETLPYSNTEDIAQLVNESNVNIPGLFAYRVDTDKIDAGGCNNNITMATFRPRTSSQLGSTALNIQGPCFTSETNVKCQFGSSSETVNGLVIDDFRAICLTPFASVHGRVPVRISIDNGHTYIPAGTFTYAPLQFGSDEVIIETEDGDNLLHIEQYIKLKWYFSEMVRNTFPNDTKIDIQLWTVNLNPQSKLEKDDHFIVLKSNLDFTDSVRIQLPSSIFYISTCFIRVVAHYNSQTYAGLNTGLLVIRNHPSLAPELCQHWADQQPEPTTWNGDSLLQCPMTRQQAIAAGRCCYEPDRQCSLNNPNSNNCWLHQARPGHDEPSAVECYLSITTNRHGARAECCYDNETMLITRGTGAGTDDRYGSSTSPVQHFFHDTLPYLQCCVMSTYNESCIKYIHYRPPRRGSNTMGETGLMWGDPHFGTLDGLSYTFNGYGEYTYLAISNSISPPSHFDPINQSYIFMSQIRTIPISTSNATVTKGFAARSNDTGAESISVTISRREQLILRRGNETIEFEDNIDVMYFPELTISRLDGNSHSHFSFAWIIGVTIEINVIKMTVPSEQLVLNIGASVAGIFRGRTYGLLGTYDGIKNNDLRSRSGSIISSNATLEQIHNEFGTTWAINPLTSLFHYESDQSAEFFERQNRDFIASFDDPTAIDNASVRSACTIDGTSVPSSWSISQRACYYDLSVTGDINFAKISFHAGDELSSIRENQKKPPLFKSSLPIDINLNDSESINLTISALSEYSSHAVQLLVKHLPMKATFNDTTGLFKWTAIKGEHYLSITARDTTNNLTSKHDITFFVNDFAKSINNTNSTINTSTIKSDNGSYSCFNGINYLLLMFAIIIFFSQ